MTTGGTLTFNDGEFVDVSVNGVALVAGTDYNTTTANTIGGLSALSANDQVEIVVYDTFSVFGGNVDADFNINNGNLSVSGTSTLTGAVTASGGATLSSSSSGEFNALTISQADNTSGNESRIRFKRTTDAGSDREVAAIVADRVGGNDTALVFETNTDGSDGATERARISHDGKFGVGTNSPQSVTHFKGTASGENILHLDNSAGSGHGDTNNNVRVVSGNNGYWANLVIAAHSLEFKVQGGSTGITAESDGDLSIADGNLVLASGHGISFAATSDTSATGASMANELFDDYEEGTWTPTLGGNTSYTSQAGRYTKIGRYVLADFDLTVNVLGTGSGAILQGLPFTVENSGGVFSGHVSFYTTLAANVMSLDCYAIANTDDIYFTGHTTASGNIGKNLTIFQNSARVIGTVHYFAA
jgi:hypothetical protein